MSDKEVALELLKIAVHAAPTRYVEPAKLFELFRECLAAVREKQG